MTPSKKICPYCGEEIMATAKKCRYCGEWFEEKIDPITTSTQTIVPPMQQPTAPKEPISVVSNSTVERIVPKGFLSVWQYIFLSITASIYMTLMMFAFDSIESWIGISLRIINAILLLTFTCLSIKKTTEGSVIRKPLVIILIAAINMLINQFICITEYVIITSNHTYTEYNYEYFSSSIYTIFSIFRTIIQNPHVLLSLGFIYLAFSLRSTYLKIVSIINCVAFLINGLIYSVKYHGWGIILFIDIFLSSIFIFMFAIKIFNICHKNVKFPCKQDSNSKSLNTAVVAALFYVIAFLISQLITLSEWTYYYHTMGLYDIFSNDNIASFTTLLVVLSLYIIIAVGMCQKRLYSIILMFITNTITLLFLSKIFITNDSLLDYDDILSFYKGTFYSLFFLPIIISLIPLGKKNGRSAYSVIWNNGI